MFRKTFLLTAAVCYFLGIWSGVVLERGTCRTDGLATAAIAAEPQSPVRDERNRHPSGSTGARVVMSAAQAKSEPSSKSESPIHDGKLRIICFGAHPDDCEIKAGGTAALWAAAGHHVKFVSLTNGDIGHWREAGGPLAQRRNAEVQRAADILGITTEVLDNHDGELLPTLENRRAVTRLIREWKADIVMGPRTNDYHPDHRYTGTLVQDAAYMVAVPFFCPDTRPLKQNPVFLYFADHFQKPYPFQADIAVGIDAVLARKLDALVGMESQFVEGGALGSADLIAGGEAKRQERRKTVHDNFAKRDRASADKYREQLVAWYGDQGRSVTSAEAFEVCEYGRQPSKEELRTLFPFFGTK
jgi:LmbE family N-acetylglucosaminyl deacetylase